MASVYGAHRYQPSLLAIGKKPGNFILFLARPLLAVAAMFGLIEEQ